MTRCFLFHVENIPALTVAWPAFPQGMDGAGIELDASNSITLFEAYGERETPSGEKVAFDRTLDVTSIPAESRRALAALALAIGEEVGQIGEAP